MKLLYIFTAVFTLVIIIWVAGFFFMKGIAIENPELAGQYGDMFGGVTSLFSGLAFAGLIITLVLQKNELKLQREVLQDQRHELELTREVMELQTKEIKEQRINQSIIIKMDKMKSLPRISVEFSSKSKLSFREMLSVIIYRNKKNDTGVSFKKVDDDNWEPFYFEFRLIDGSPSIRDLVLDKNRYYHDNVLLELAIEPHYMVEGQSFHFCLWVKRPDTKEIDDFNKQYACESSKVLRVRHLIASYTTEVGSEVEEELRFTGNIGVDQSGIFTCTTHGILHLTNSPQ